MHVTTVLGSPPKNGNTATILDAVERELGRRGHVTERITIVDHDVGGCLGCNACRTLEEQPGCVQRDDAIALFKKLIASDAVVYGTALYTYGFPAQMKAFIDRQYCLVTGHGTPGFHSWLRGKPSLLLVSCGGPAENNADLIQEVFSREGAFQKWDVRDGVIVPGCGSPDQLGDRAASSDYITVQAYLPPGDDLTAALSDLQTALRDRFHLATAVGYGPRFLHSTVRLHKGIEGTDSSSSS